MVDVIFKTRAKHFVPLSLMKRIAGLAAEPSEDVAYIGEDGVEAIKNMTLIKRGRLSVQPVNEDAWRIIHELADNGGWTEDEKKTKKKDSGEPGPSSAKAKPRRAKRTTKQSKVTENESEADDDVFDDNEERHDEPGDEKDIELGHKRDRDQAKSEAEGAMKPSESVDNQSRASQSKRRKLDGDIEEEGSSPRRRSTRVRK